MESARRAFDRRSFDHGADDSLRICEKLTRRGRRAWRAVEERLPPLVGPSRSDRDRHRDGHGRLARAKSARTGFRAGGGLARNVDPNSVIVGCRAGARAAPNRYSRPRNASNRRRLSRARRRAAPPGQSMCPRQYGNRTWRVATSSFVAPGCLATELLDHERENDETHSALR